MYLVPHAREIEQIFGGENIYKAEKFPYISHHNVQLQKCFFDNGVIKTLQKNILQTMTTRIDKIKSTYWSPIFTHIFYEQIDETRILLIHDFIEETIYDKCEFLDIQQKINLMMEITSHLQQLHQNNIAHQQLTPYTIGWIRKNNQLPNLVLYGFGLPIEINLRKPKRSQDEIDYSYRDPLFQYQKAYDFPSSQVCKQNDIWSLGAVFYYLLTSENLFENSKKNDENILNPLIIDEIFQNQKPGNKLLAPQGLQKLKNLLKDMLSKDTRPNIDQVQRRLREIHSLGYINRIAQSAFQSPVKENQNLPQPPAFPNQTLPVGSTPTKQVPFCPTSPKEAPPAHAVPPQQNPLPFPMNQQQPNFYQQPNLIYAQSLKTPQQTFQGLAGHHHYQTAPQTQKFQQFNNPNQANQVQAQAAVQQQSLIFIQQQAAPTAQQAFQNPNLNGQSQNQFKPNYSNAAGFSTPQKEK